MDQDFDTMQLPGAPDAVAPDGSDVRVLLRLGRGSMAHFELAAGRAYDVPGAWPADGHPARVLADRGE